MNQQRNRWRRMHGASADRHPRATNRPSCRPITHMLSLWLPFPGFAGDSVYLFPEDENSPHYLGRIVSAFVDENAGHADPHCIEVGGVQA